MSDDAPGFLSRWSRRKAALRQGGVVAEPTPAGPTLPPALVTQPSATTLPPPPLGEHVAPAVRPLAADVVPGGPVQTTTVAGTATAHARAPGEALPGEPVQAMPTLAEVAQLTPASDFRRFVAPGVDAGVRNAALKTLFRDPHFNVMDGLDTYIDDYGRPDPLPVGMLRQMAQSKFLGLFSDDEPAPAENAPPDEDTDLRLQPHAEAGPRGAAPGAGEDAGREH